MIKRRAPAVPVPVIAIFLLALAAASNMIRAETPALSLLQADDGTVTLGWDANTETNVAGYFVYRSNTSGSGYQRLNSDPVTVTTYTDTALVPANVPPCGDPAQAGFFYVATAVNDAGLESGFSNEVSVTATVTIAPCPPTGLRIASTTSGNRVTIAYHASPGATLYQIAGVKANGDVEEIGQTVLTEFELRQRGYRAVMVRALADGVWGEYGEALELR